MHDLQQLEKQQVGLRLHAYLVDEIDELTKQFSVNRTDIIVEAIKSYLSAQKTHMLYESFDSACQELKSINPHSLSSTKTAKLNSLDSLIKELEE